MGLSKSGPLGKLMFQNTQSTEIRCTEASHSLFVDLILMASILGSVHVEAILCDKGAGKKPGDSLDHFTCTSVFLNQSIQGFSRAGKNIRTNL